MRQRFSKTHSQAFKPRLIALAVSQALMNAPIQAAIINVDTQGTPGGCTLIEAITTANSDQPSITCVQGSGPDNINLPANSTFSYTVGVSGGTNPVGSALPPITSYVTINGNGSTVNRDVTATQGFRFFEVEYDGNLTLNNTTLSGAKTLISGTDSRGGAIYVLCGRVTIEESTLSNNSSPADGGAIFAKGIQLFCNGFVGVYDSTLSSNSAGSKGGGIYAKDASFVNISNSTVTTNSSNGDGGGLYIGYVSQLALSGSTLSNNNTDASGAGIAAADSAYVGVTNSTVSGNTASLDGGGIYADNADVSLTNSTLSGNTADLNGGGIAARSGASVTLGNSNVLGNFAKSGAGILASISDLSLSNSTISGNSASFLGGAIFASSAIIDLNSSTLSGNSAFNGGGVNISVATLNLSNSTLSSNIAKNSGGGLYAGVASTSTFTNSTFSGNKVVPDGMPPAADGGGGLWADGSAQLGMFNTVIANNSPLDCGGQKPGGLASLLNWFEDDSCSDTVGAGNGDPKLGALNFNGGPTKTHGPLTGSGLEGAGTLSFCTGSPINNKDQRGQTRNIPCFIGAVDDIVEPTVFFTIPLSNGKAVVIPL